MHGRPRAINHRKRYFWTPIIYVFNSTTFFSSNFIILCILLRILLIFFSFLLIEKGWVSPHVRNLHSLAMYCVKVKIPSLIAFECHKEYKIRLEIFMKFMNARRGRKSKIKGKIFVSFKIKIYFEGNSGSILIRTYS